MNIYIYIYIATRLNGIFSSDFLKQYNIPIHLLPPPTFVLSIYCEQRKIFKYYYFSALSFQN